MKILSIQDLDAGSRAYDEAVASTPGIDRFCSSSLWILPAARHLMVSPEPLVRHVDGHYLALLRTPSSDGGLLLQPFEAMWALACPLVGPDPQLLAELVAETLGRDGSWNAAFLAGLSEGSALWKALVRALHGHYSLLRGPETRRFLADLTSGEEGFLSRRSAGLRKKLRQARRRSEARGITFDVAESSDPTRADPLYERMLDVERRSWKGRRGVGIDRGAMCRFYRDMNRRLVERGLQRLLFARCAGRDVAYIFGGLFGRTYRGLQFSYDERFRDLSLGNLCQLEQVASLAREGVEIYDLGTDVRYKRRWGEQMFATASIVVRR